MSNLPPPSFYAAASSDAVSVGLPREIRPPSDPSGREADSFRTTMNIAQKRASQPEAAVSEPDRAHATSSVSGAAKSIYSSIESRFASIQRDAFDLGSGFDVTRPESAVLAYERQVRLTSSLLQYQSVIQGAENVKSAIKTLTQLQG